MLTNSEGFKFHFKVTQKPLSIKRRGGGATLINFDVFLFAPVAYWKVGRRFLLVRECIMSPLTFSSVK